MEGNCMNSLICGGDDTPTRTDPLLAVFSFIRQLSEEKYFGQIQLSFQSGQLVNIRTDQSYKPSDIPVGISKGTPHANRSSQ
jgi:hypothetical protein